MIIHTRRDYEEKTYYNVAWNNGCGIGCSYEKGNIESENELCLVDDLEQNMISINISEIQELGETHVSYVEEFLQNKLCEMSGNEFGVLCVSEDTQNKLVGL